VLRAERYSGKVAVLRVEFGDVESQIKSCQPIANHVAAEVSRPESVQILIAFCGLDGHQNETHTHELTASITI
jgi:hypothetical protein